MIYEHKYISFILLLNSSNKMDTPIIKSKIKDLQSEVSNYIRGPKKYFSNMNLESFLTYPRVYIVIAVGVFFFLMIFTPDYAMEEYMNDDGEVKNRILYKKLFVLWFIISAVLVIGLFLYNYKKNEQ